MKALKVIGKIILVFLPVILVWIFLASAPYSYMDGEYSYYREGKDYRMGKTDIPNADVLILGDSRAKSAILPELLDELGGSENCVSLAQGGSTSVEAYYALTEYIANRGVPKKVFLSESAYHFTSFDGFWTRTVYFDAITFSDAMEVIRSAKANQEEAALKEAGGSNVFSLLEYKITEFVPLETLDQYYRKIIDLCVENDIEIYSLNMPLIATTFEESKKISEPFSAYFETLQKDYPAAQFPKVHIETSFAPYDEKFFDDADHLNEDGARVYTSWLVQTYGKEAS